MKHFLSIIALIFLWLSQYSLAADKSSSDEVPSTVQECVEILKKRESKQTLASLKATKENEIFKFNRGLGAAIRNDWIWSHPNSKLVKFFVSKGVRQPDGMSAAIIHCLLRDLNHKPFDLDRKLSQLRSFEDRQKAVGVEKLIIPQSILNTKLPLNNNKSVKLADYRGKLLVLIMLESSCPIPTKEMNKLQADFKGKNVEFLGLLSPSSSSEFEQFKKDFNTNYKLNFPVVLYEPTNFSYNIYLALVDPGIMTFPETFLINTESRMIARYKGWETKTPEIIEAHIKQALAGQELKQ